jgi:hypothetical protein
VGGVTTAASGKRGPGVNQRGYRLVYVGPDHPMADSDGRVGEHRLVMAERLGRMLLPSEIVHHVDGDRSNNTPSNLWLFAGQGSHCSWHAMVRKGRELRMVMSAVSLRTPG